jgi:hypothetical protein
MGGGIYTSQRYYEESDRTIPIEQFIEEFEEQATKEHEIARKEYYSKSRLEEVE